MVHDAMRGQALAMESDLPSNPVQVRDLMWVWELAGVGTDGPHTPATYAQASPADR